MTLLKDKTIAVTCSQCGHQSIWPMVQKVVRGQCPHCGYLQEVQILVVEKDYPLNVRGC
jgi:ribosomal protein L37E